MLPPLVPAPRECSTDRGTIRGVHPRPLDFGRWRLIEAGDRSDVDRSASAGATIAAAAAASTSTGADTRAIIATINAHVIVSRDDMGVAAATAAAAAVAVSKSTAVLFDGGLAVEDEVGEEKVGVRVS